jgi:hypothetical protein
MSPESVETQVLLQVLTLSAAERSCKGHGVSQ